MDKGPSAAKREGSTFCFHRDERQGESDVEALSCVVWEPVVTRGLIGACAALLYLFLLVPFARWPGPPGSCAKFSGTR